MHPNLHSSTIYNSQDMEATQMSINRQLEGMVYECVYICVNVYMYVCVYIYVGVHVYINIYIYKYIHT